MALVFNLYARNRHVDYVVLNNAHQLDIYTGSHPADANATTTGELVVQITPIRTATSGEFIGSNGTQTWSGTATGTALMDGTFGYARLVEDDNRTYVIQGSVGTADLNDFVVNAGTCASGDVVNLTKLAFIYPEEY